MCKVGNYVKRDMHDALDTSFSLFLFLFSFRELILSWLFWLVVCFVASYIIVIDSSINCILV